MHRSAALLLTLFLAAPGGRAAAPALDRVLLPEVSQVVISPDGRHLAAAIRSGALDCLAILKIEDLPEIGLTHRECPIGGETLLPGELRWAGKDRVVFATGRSLGNFAAPVRSGRIHAVDVDGTGGRLVYGPVIGSDDPAVADARILDELADDDARVLVATTPVAAGGQRLRTRVERVDVNTGEATLVLESPLAGGTVLADAQGRVRFATGTTATGERRFAWRPDEDASWIERPSPFPGEVEPLAFEAGGESVLVQSDWQGELGVWRVHGPSGERSPVLLDPRSEVRRVIHGRSRGEVIGAVFEPDYPRLELFDPEHPAKALLARVAQSFPGREVRIESHSSDGRLAVVAAGSDRAPVSWHLLDTQTLELRFLVASMPWISPSRMSEREPFVLRVRDGMTMTGYLTLPPDGREEDLPAVILVHGGPHGVHDHWQYDLEAQLLASRGYAVLQLNYRGSGGFGEQFEQAGHRRWGTAMQDDLTDATMWLIDEGVAARDRVCIYGAGYGGYAVLAGITREPDLYACAFAYGGIYDLDALFEQGELAQTPQGRALLRQTLGDREDDAEDIAARSPLQRVNRIKTPLFVAHGRADGLVPIAQYEALLRALEAARIPHRELVFDDEAHGIADPGNRLKYYTELLEFLARHTARAGD